ncbi:MAG: Ubiquinone/menaquinone biosynthesis C-methyltransferase UbiE [Alphaproteobacteria bacterium MarineAlpha5_Bin8]|nr:MAG: Ubiquinone/menaquinone biosynthesis C-methyltransferase UbiE [Alphaproteobacteria bacterium MarineAlpha5_Bin7]PPR48208.1 MAG: Ubiquinone/menaquinone biosynthesis C-methyltransferase UbiE [Alphaproteobacteria bacterium MarineAlpha5_Bin8]PPR52859.1 MAG: Ubiquinone/menaquinone biosynthesis C-methyltransferase UbiE [Alphaproteobacteria bacterium MarineAlpha5_Bin6]|tara:strand:+ start:2014 stop:2754 length:741 start_codon:yes stop_codon:yes gene_type:complete
MNNLKTNFGKRKIKISEKTSLVQSLFTNVSKNYDLMNDLMSFGTHRIWKKTLLEIMNIRSNEKIIDVGSGTGDLIKLITKKNNNNEIYCVDLNANMLNECKNKFKNNKYNKIKFINANAENLPFQKNIFDKYIISFCLRNVTHIEKALSEAHRILKPGGSFYCLEFSTPNTTIINSLYNEYKKKIIPFLGDKIANNKDAYKYLDESISLFPNQESLLDMINDAGFTTSNFINIFDGIVSIHKGYKV